MSRSNMRLRQWIAGFALVVALSADNDAQAQPAASSSPLSPEFAKLRDLIEPTAGESYWSQIPWIVDMYTARQKAAAEGKPLLVWSMAAEVLGHC